MQNNRLYFANQESSERLFNRWDIMLLLLITCSIFFISLAAKQMTLPYQLGTPLSITLNPYYLPWYALRTVLRLFIALMISLLFTFIIGTWAAKNKKAERIIIPSIDILQSVPVLSFLSITVTGFISLFPNSLLGPECAAIFAIFVSQVWNITFGFYQSLKTLPHDLLEASQMFQLSSWQRFWKVEVPFSMPGLIWNMMVSMSASWFFVVLSEAISVAHQNIRLPGIGSYIALAIENKNIISIFYAIITMIIVIFLYDQILFRPLIAWSEKFNMNATPVEDSYESWLIDWLRKSLFMRKIGYQLSKLRDIFINGRLLRHTNKQKIKPSHPINRKNFIINGLLILAVISGTYHLYFYLKQDISYQDILHTAFLGSITSLRVVILIILSSLLWVPIGILIGLKPKVAQRVQPIIQFLAAFPANLFYPIFVIAIVNFQLNPEIWLTPLMILGTQWYILFNVIAGSQSIPRELYLAAANFGVKRWLWWKRVALPGIFPFYITGAITAAGGAWNASIVAEWVNWGHTTLTATGLGAYIQAATHEGSFTKIALGTTMMCIYVLLFNHLVWRPLYAMAESRFNLN